MNVQRLIELAKEYDVSKGSILPKEVIKVNNYLGMIRDKGQRVIDLTKKTEGYMADLEEYIGQLDGMGVHLLPKPSLPKGDQRPIGVIPNEQDLS